MYNPPGLMVSLEIGEEKVYDHPSKDGVTVTLRSHV